MQLCRYEFVSGYPLVFLPCFLQLLNDKAKDVQLFLQFGETAVDAVYRAQRRADLLKFLLRGGGQQAHEQLVDVACLGDQRAISLSGGDQIHGQRIGRTVLEQIAGDLRAVSSLIPNVLFSTTASNSARSLGRPGLPEGSSHPTIRSSSSRHLPLAIKPQTSGWLSRVVANAPMPKVLTLFSASAISAAT